MQAPGLIVRSGVCEDSRLVYLSMDSNSETSFSASFTVPKSLDWIYVDNVDSNVYSVFSKAAKTGTKSFQCGNHNAGEEEEHGMLQDEHLEPIESRRQQRRLLDDSSSSFSQQRMFRLALVANNEFSAYFGNTLSSVSAGVAAVMARVNGIFMRELGIYFQLVPGNDRLLCLPEQANNCSELLPNKQGLTVVNNAKTFIASRGVTEYDIGHVFTTGSGGLAGVAVLCNQDRKAMGTTGLSNPIGDVFSVDYVTHELGHQLSGLHSFKDCAGSNEVPRSSVEPGSGSTILSYAGTCGSLRNLQANSHPYFDAYNLKEMAKYIQNVVAANPNTCGVPIDASNAPKQVEIILPSAAEEAEYTIPIGNNFMLRGATRTSSMVPPSRQPEFYLWDRIDTGLQAFSDLKLPSFRSWKPSAVPHRYFPNQFFLTNNLSELDPYRKAERLPVRPISMQFRFVAKTLFDSTMRAYSAPSSVASLGSFAVRDITLHFVNTVAALEFSPSTRRLLEMQQVVEGSKVLFQWTKNGAEVREVEILYAVHTMDLASNGQVYNYNPDVHLKELVWISLSSGPVLNEEGKVLLRLPRFSSKTIVNFMIRPFEEGRTSACYPFDLIARTTLNVDDSASVIIGGDQGEYEVLETRPPTTSSPSMAPTTAMPTVAPTTAMPTVAPTTATPTTATPSMTPTTAAPTMAPTTATPTVAPTRRPSKQPTKKPSKRPTTFPTKRPTKRSKAPTTRPSNKGSKKL